MKVCEDKKSHELYDFTNKVCINHYGKCNIFTAICNGTVIRLMAFLINQAESIDDYFNMRSDFII